MTDQNLRITSDELRSRMNAGEDFTIIDSRNPQSWAEARDMASGAVRVDAHSQAALPELPRARPIVIYCT